MAAYATVSDVQARSVRQFSQSEQTVLATLLDDAAVIIDTAAPDADDEIKKTVSCRMVIRAIGDGGSMGVPIGSTQGSMGGLGYTQSWTVGAGGSVGELYLSRQDKRLLGVANKIGSHSPTEELVCSGESQ